MGFQCDFLGEQNFYIIIPNTLGSVPFYQHLGNTVPPGSHAYRQLLAYYPHKIRYEWYKMVNDAVDLVHFSFIFPAFKEKIMWFSDFFIQILVFFWTIYELSVIIC